MSRTYKEISLNLADILIMLRGWTLLILEVKGEGQDGHHWIMWGVGMLHFAFLYFIWVSLWQSMIIFFFKIVSNIMQVFISIRVCNDNHKVVTLLSPCCRCFVSPQSPSFYEWSVWCQRKTKTRCIKATFYPWGTFDGRCCVTNNKWRSSATATGENNDWHWSTCYRYWYIVNCCWA